MSNWFEKACAQLEQDHSYGLIDYKEYQIEMRNLELEYEQYAREDAENVYNSYFN